MSYDNDFFEYGWEDMITDEGSEWIPLPEGDYDFTVKKVERARYQGSDKMPPCNMAKVTVKVTGEAGSAEITENLFLCNKLEWKLSQFFLSIGLKKHGEPLKMNWSAAIGRTGRCRVYIDTYVKKNGSQGQSNKIDKFLPPEERSAAANAGGGWKAGAF